MKKYSSKINCSVVGALIITLISACATQQGYQGAGVGALTGATAGILLDPDNRWRGAMIGGGLGAVLGGALTDYPQYNNAPQYSNYPQYGNYPPYGNYPQDSDYPYNSPYTSPSSYYAPPPPPPSYTSQNRVAQGALVGGLTGATAGALLDDDNAWRGGAIGALLGTIFGGSIGAINSGPSIPVLNP